MKDKIPKGPWIIAIIALSLVAVFLILGNQSFQASERVAFDEFNQRQLVLAREAASGVELYFENLAGDMKTLARAPEIQRFDEAPARREIRYMFYELESWGVNDVAILDADGFLKYNAAAPQIEGTDFSWRRYYQEVQVMTCNEATYVVEFIEFKGVDAGQKGVLIAVPMFETTVDEKYPAAPSGRFVGVALCTLKLDTITQKFVAPIRSSARGHALLIDDEYHVLWSPDRALFGQNLLEASAGFPALQQVVERMGVGSSGTAEYTYYAFVDSASKYARNQREEILITHTPIHLGNELWSIGVWAPKEDVRQSIRSVYLGQLLVVGLSVLTVLVGSSYILATSLRRSKFLKQEIETKTREVLESHEQLLMVLGSLDAAVYVADMETYEILFANEYLREIYGDLVGKTCWKALQSDQSGPCDFCTNEKLLDADGEPSGVYAWEFQAPATGHWYEIRDRAIRWVDGHIVRLEIAIDVTERKQAEKTLMAVHAFQQSIIDGVGVPIMMIDPDHRVTLMNQAAREFVSQLADTSEPLLCHRISHQRETPCDGTVHPCPLEQVRESGQSTTVIHEYHLTNGERRIYQAIASPLVGANGTFQGIVESLHDVTEHKWAEEALAQQGQMSTRPNDELEYFAHRVVQSIQDLFTDLPADED